MTAALRLVCIVLVLTMSASAQKPDFTGLWVFNPVESNLENPERPVTSTFLIIHRGERWHLQRTDFMQAGAPDTKTVDYVIDNRPASSTNDARDTIITRMYWQENALVMDQQITDSDNEHATNRVAYTLSSDGNKLTALELETFPHGRFRNSWVFDRLSLPTMRNRWPGTGLSTSQVSSLKNAIHRNDSDCDPQSKELAIDYATVSLGKARPGVLVRSQAPCDCGATGNCAIWAYQQNGNIFHELPFRNDSVPFGWAYGITTTASGTLFLAVGSHFSAERTHYSLYEFVDGLFTEVGNTCVKPTDTADRSPSYNWFNLPTTLLPSCDSR